MTTYPSGRQELENFVDIYFKMTYIIGTMKVPFITFMDGLTGRYIYIYTLIRTYV